jgi:hypothetical protein
VFNGSSSSTFSSVLIISSPPPSLTPFDRSHPDGDEAYLTVALTCTSLVTSDAECLCLGSLYHSFVL